MNFKLSLLSVIMLAVSVCVVAQTARNPLNHEPARILLKKGNSSWKLSDETFYRTNGAQFNKISYVYDENGKVVSDITQQWDANGGSWENISKSEYVSMDNKKITISSVYKAGWQNATKTEDVLNAEGKQLYSLTYSWSDLNNDWSVDPSLKCEWIYDESGRVTEYLKRRMNNNTNEWNDYFARILYSYDNNGDINEELFQYRDDKNKSWIDGGKYTYTKENEKNTAVSYFHVPDKWVFDGKTVYLYDQEGKIVRSEYYGNDSSESMRAYSLFAYSESIGSRSVLAETEDINVYPNPVISSFELTVPDELIGNTASLFDVFGKQVKSFVVNSGKMQVDVSGLTGGVYILNISDKTKRLIIK